MQGAARAFALTVALLASRLNGQSSGAGISAAGNVAPDSTQQSLQRQALDQEKLRQEIKKLELENQKLSGWRGFFSSNAAFLTSIVAMIGVIIAIWKQVDENKSRRKQFEM